MYFCGYNKSSAALDFHHLDGSKKRFWYFAGWYNSIMTKGAKRTWKCILVCANCHREIHAGISQLSGVIQNEKWGELREALNGNPDPSLTKDIKVVKKEQRLRVRSQTNKL